MTNSLLFSINQRDDLFIDGIVELTNKSSTLENQLSVGYLKKQKFSDGEICVDFIDSVRGKKVFLLLSPLNSNDILRLAFSIDAAKRAGASEIIPILPYFPYSRQDKKDQVRGPIGAKVIAEIIEQRGATSVILFDLHADQIQGFFNIPVTHIESKNVFDNKLLEVVKTLGGPNEVVLCGPDAGSGKRIKRMRDQLNKHYNINLNYVIIDKTRKKANFIDEMVVIGNVENKHVIILDDIVDTAGTLCKASTVLLEAGAKSVKAVISHGVLSGSAMETIGESDLSEIIISDSVQLKKPIELCEKDFNELRCHSILIACKKLTTVSLLEQIALSISATMNKFSYESLVTKNITYTLETN